VHAERYLKLNYITLCNGIPQNPSSPSVSTNALKTARQAPTYHPRPLTQQPEAKTNSLSANENSLINQIVSNDIYNSSAVINQVENCGTYNSPTEPKEIPVHTNSFKGLTLSFALYSLCSERMNTVVMEICDLFGAIYFNEYSECVDYVISDSVNEYIQELAAGWKKPLISHRWLFDCISKRAKLDPREYLIG
jgi:hypothetical protein